MKYIMLTMMRKESWWQRVGTRGCRRKWTRRRIGWLAWRVRSRMVPLVLFIARSS